MLFCSTLVALGENKKVLFNSEKFDRLFFFFSRNRKMCRLSCLYARGLTRGVGGGRTVPDTYDSALPGVSTPQHKERKPFRNKTAKVGGNPINYCPKQVTLRVKGAPLTITPAAGFNCNCSRQTGAEDNPTKKS